MAQHATFWETHHILWSEITGSLACKMNYFVQNKSQGKKPLEDKMEENWLS